MRFLPLVAYATAVFLLSPVGSAETDCRNVSVPYDSEIQLKRTQDSQEAGGYLVPANLEEAIKELDAMLPADFRRSLMCTSESEMIQYHHGFGTWIRNNWKLWAGGRLARDFHEMGVQHPDDMSGIILTSYHRYLHGQPIDLDEQIAHYQAYWEAHQPPPDLSCADGSTVSPSSSSSSGRPPWHVVWHAQCPEDGSHWDFDKARGWHLAE